MRKRIQPPVLQAVLFVSAVAVAAQAAPSGSAENESVRAVDNAWAAAFKANDLEAVMRCYAPDAVAWLPDFPEARGEKAIREAFRSFFAENKVDDAKFSETHYEMAGARALGWGDSRTTDD